MSEQHDDHPVEEMVQRMKEKSKNSPPSSGLAGFIMLLGWLSLIGGVLLFLEADYRGSALPAYAALGAGIQLLIFAHLIKLFTNMHFYLKGIYEK